MALKIHKRVVAGLMLLATVQIGFSQRVSPDIARTKSSEALRSVFKDASALANKSTVMIKADDKGTSRQVALGTIVSAEGYILTKASEVMGQTRLRISLISGSTAHVYDAKVVGVNDGVDLAMLKIDAKGLMPIVFADTRPLVPDAPAAAPDTAAAPGGGAGQGRGRGRGRRGGPGGGGPGVGFGRGPVVMPGPATAPAPAPGAIGIDVGEWVASASPAASLKSDTDDEPFAVGIVSVSRRRIPRSNGYLGVSLGDTDGEQGAKIMQVLPMSVAEHAGLQLDDVVTSVNGKSTPNAAAFVAEMRTLRPGDVVTLKVERADQSLTLHATLGTSIQLEPEESMTQAMIVGAVSGRASDFPAVFQNDTVIRPVDCGGPVVDLAGHVIGINIARAGRTDTYTLPADLILPLIEPLESGKLAPADAK